MAAATISAFLFLGGAVNLATAALAGVLMVVIAAQFHASRLRRREKREVARELVEMKQTSRVLAESLSETRAGMDTMKAAIEARTTDQSRRIVAELQVLESLMREFAGRIADKSRAQPVALEAEPEVRQIAAPPQIPMPRLGEGDLLEIIRAALEENRVDLYLQPIVSLPQRKLRFYEALTRLRAEDGAVIMPAQYMRVAGPVGLMSVVDNLLLFRCVQIVRRLTQKNRELGIFCNISGETLGDAEFFPQFLEYMHHNRDMAPHIVFEFAQNAVIDVDPRVEENLSYLSGLGFALSMDHVETLDCNFAKLRQLGFRHLKVRAETLTGGMNAAHAQVAAEDLKALLARHAINLIAERVEQEKTVVQLLDFGVDCGQGFLFGEPRAVREEAGKLPAELAAPVIPFRRAG
jgi:cyclic-di-GMP phosphodiesterase TipF (flagellum assembly factor)